MSGMSKVETWTVSQFVRAAGPHGDSVEKRYIEIPKYQRNIVWSEKQQRSLIETLVDGMPIGAVLLYNYGHDDRLEDRDNYQRLLLIDGLQRCTALRAHFDAPTKAFSDDHVPPTIVRKLCDRLGLSDEAPVRSSVSQWIQSLHGWSLAHNYASVDLAKAVIPRICPNPEPAVIADHVLALSSSFNSELNELARRYDIGDRQIPVLIYGGDSSNLPTIFERLNSSGTKLSKYEIFAASWLPHKVSADDSEIVERVVSKYAALAAQGYEVENFDAASPTLGEKITYYEYLFGLGKLLTDKFPRLYRERLRQTDDVESIGFNLTGLCVGCDLKNLAKLPNFIPDAGVNSLRRAIQSASERVDSLLAPILALKANRRQATDDAEVTKFHSEFQIASYVASVFQSEFERSGDNWIQRRVPSFERTALEKNLIPRFVIETLQNKWAGTGDEKAMDLVSKGLAFSSVSREAMKGTLDQWRTQDLERKDRRRKVSSETELILRTFYAMRWSAAHQLGPARFDIEHLVPIERLKAQFGPDDSDPGRAINAIGNLCFLRDTQNRGKKKLTYFEYLDEMRDRAEIDEAAHRDAERKFTEMNLVTRDDLTWLAKAEAAHDKQAFWAGYEHFISQRSERVNNQLVIDYLGI